MKTIQIKAAGDIPGKLVTCAQANELRLRVTPATGLVLTDAILLTAQLRDSRTSAETPLASTTLADFDGGSPYDLDFTAPQMNQPLAGEAYRDLWLVIFSTTAEGVIEIWHAGPLRLLAHGASSATAAPPVPVGFLLLADSGAAGRALLACADVAAVKAYLGIPAGDYYVRPS